MPRRLTDEERDATRIARALAHLGAARVEMRKAMNRVEETGRGAKGERLAIQSEIARAMDANTSAHYLLCDLKDGKPVVAAALEPTDEQGETVRDHLANCISALRGLRDVSTMERIGRDLARIERSLTTALALEDRRRSQARAGR